MKKNYIWGAVALLAAGGFFYGGMVYGKSTAPAAPSAAFSVGGTGARFAGARAGGGLTAGQIIAKDATSVTVQMQDGSTKIVLVSSGTQVLKTTAGTLSDLSIGTNVAVTGSANSDGSVTAQTVQIRPQGKSAYPQSGGSAPAGQ